MTGEVVVAEGRFFSKIVRGLKIETDPYSRPGYFSKTYFIVFTTNNIPSLLHTLV